MTAIAHGELSVELSASDVAVEVRAIAHEITSAEEADAAAAPPVLAQVPLAQVRLSERWVTRRIACAFPTGAGGHGRSRGGRIGISSGAWCPLAGTHGACELVCGARHRRAWRGVVLRLAISDSESGGGGGAPYSARDAEKSLGTITLQGLDRWLLKTSRLEAGEVGAVRSVFETPPPAPGSRIRWCFSSVTLHRTHWRYPVAPLWLLTAG